MKKKYNNQIKLLFDNIIEGMSQLISWILVSNTFVAGKHILLERNGEIVSCIFRTDSAQELEKEVARYKDVSKMLVMTTDVISAGPVILVTPAECVMDINNIMRGATKIVDRYKE